ncbi:MAG: aldehyde ferredoxin oxidoreductase family protein, partial [Candidatus Bathyarchaeia archaeon]
MKYGWAGTILRVNLTEEKVWKTPLEKDLALNYLGGRGLNVKILYDELKLRIDPLGPENILVFGIGPVNGTLAPGSNRYTVSALSPLGNMLGDGNSGGFFGAMLKFAGYDAIVIYGAARKPVYLWIDDESVEIKSADHIWGKTTWETDTIIKKEIGDEDIGMVYIGQAGENLVRYACVMNERARAAARCGIGAVMGSKKLKAIAVRGTKDVSVANPKALIEVIKKNYEALLLDEGYYKAFSIQGSPSLVDLYQDMGALPTKNFQRGTFEGASKISGNVFISDYAVRSKACFSCPLHCSHWYRVEKGPYAGIEGEGLEFETICGFGSRCGNSDLSSILMANELCNKYGLDTISTSSTIAFAIECFEKGLISIEDTGGIKLEWGNHEQIISLIHKIAKREDFGNFLAEGVERMANRIGNEARKIAPVIKGVDIINVDPRGPKAWALGFAVASRGADHLRAFPIGEFHFPPSLAEEMFSTKEAVDLRGIKGKGRLVIWHENIRAIIDSLEICVYNFARTPLSKKILENSFLFPKALAKLINAVTG